MYYSVESHVKHLGEAKAGEPLFVTTQLIGVDDKRLHVFHRMHRGRDGVEIATAEQMYLHVDTAAAKAAPADAAIRAKLESIRDRHSGLPIPRSGPLDRPRAALVPAMPKIVDHAQRRDEIAHVACQVVANYGFEQATVARIARAAGYTTGMVGSLLRVQAGHHPRRLAPDIVSNRGEADARTRCRRSGSAGSAVGGAGHRCATIHRVRLLDGFLGQVSADKKLKRLNVWVHREYMRLYARCFTEHWQEWSAWPRPVRDHVLRSVVTFINGLTASAVTSPSDWPAAVQVEQLRLQLDLLRQWGRRDARGGSG